MNILRAVLQLLVVGIAGIFGVVISPESAPAVFTWLANLSPSVQIGVAISLAMLVLIPMAAPHTPWTWDDRTIKYRTKAGKVISSIWNTLAGNFGNARNAK